MTTPDPAATLRAAAAHLRALAAEATPGPWVARHSTHDGWPIETEPREAGDDPEDYDGEFGELSLVAGTALPRTDRGQEGRDPGHYQSHHILAQHEECDLAPDQAQEVLASYRWAAAIGPQVAEPLAAWLEVAAGFAKQAWMVSEPVHPLALPALDFARAVLATAPADGEGGAG